MKNLFNLNNPVFRILARIADLVILQILFLVCCLPVITAGASIAAMARVSQNMVRDEDDTVIRPFFRAFRENFKQATVVWLAALVVLAGLFSDFLLLKTFVTGSLYTGLMVILFLLLFLAVGVMNYLFPLIARYNNTVRQHVQNACILLVTQFPKTLLMTFLNLSPLLCAFFFPSVMVYTLMFWVFASCSFFAYIEAVILKPVFDKLEEGND